MTDILIDQLVGIVAVVFVLIGISWQCIKIFRTKETHAISYPWLLFTNASLLTWFMYGVLKDDPVIWVPNLIVPIIYTVFMIAKWRFEIAK